MRRGGGLTRLATPSLPKMLDTWTLAVLGEINSSAAISRLLRPAATRRSTSSSRSVRPSSPPAAPAPRASGARTASGARAARHQALGCVVAGQPDPGPPGQDRDLLGERVRGQPGGQRHRAPQPFRRAVAVAAGQRGLRRVQQRLGERIGLARPPHAAAASSQASTSSPAPSAWPAPASVKTPSRRAPCASAAAKVSWKACWAGPNVAEFLRDRPQSFG